MKDESDIISNQSDQTESFLSNNNNNNKNKSNNNKMTDCNLPSSSCNSSTKLEPQNFSSISSTITQLNDTDTLATSSSPPPPPFTPFKTQKRQFEKIKNELSDEDNLEISNITPTGLSSTSSSNSISNINNNNNNNTNNESELADNDNITSNNYDKHLIESESKRQRSDFELATPSLSKNASSSTLMEIDSDETQPSSSNSKSSLAREQEMQQPGESINTSDEDDTNLSNSKQPNLNSIPKSTVTKSSSLMTNYDDDDDLVLSNVEESQTLSSHPSEQMESELAGGTTSSSSTSTIESPSVTAVTSKSTKTSKTSKVKIDLNECHDWDRIHDTVYFKERSLNFNDMINREFGYGGRFGHGNRNNFGLNVSSKLKSRNERTVSQMQVQSARHMINKGMNSFNFVRRMQTTQNLNYHEGCVNALNFNRIGTLLASGSDDYQVCIWDWARSKVLLTFDSGHKSNVFQTKFMPFTRDSQIVTCARDGQVRLALISSSGSHIGTKKLAKHSDSCHKLSIEYDSSNMFLSCGEDAVVYEIDLRQQTPAKILTVKNYNRNCKLPLYSISNNPFDTYQFAVAGKDPYIRIYDKRMLVDDRSKILKLFAPNHLKDSQRASITSAVYNHNGTEIIGSYSDDDIYLFETGQESESDAKFRYRGHRNSETIKGVNFYGANSDFIVSGSDCGRVFFWEKTTQQIVQSLKGDENGVVNVLEPHPHFPILATSGLDSDIKIWTPSCELPNSLDNLADIIKDNQRLRDTSRHFSLSSFEFELLLLLMHRPNSRVFIRSNEEELLRSRMTERENSTNASSGGGAGAAASVDDNNINHLRTRRFLLNRIETENENESEATTTSNEEEEDDEHDEEEEEEETEDEDDFLHYDDDEDNESSYNFHEHDNEDEHFYDESDNSRLASFFTRRRYSRDRNTDSHTSDQSSSNNNSNNPNRNT